MKKECSYNNIGIIIVTYNPNSLTALFEQCSKFTNNVVVVDNNSSNIIYILQICNQYNFECIRLDKNKGIAMAINVGIMYIFSKEVSWFITFDQDSLPPDNLLQYYNEIIKNEDNIGLIGVGFDYYINKIPNICGIKYSYSHDQITSGLLHNVDMVKKIGGYESSYFIDCVDFEYSLRAAEYGYNTFTMENKIMTHSLGNPKVVYILGFPVITMNHNAFRQYYIVRNHIWLARKYMKSFPCFIMSKFYHLFIRIVKTILFDDDRKLKINKIASGFIDGFKSKCNG